MSPGESFRIPGRGVVAMLAIWSSTLLFGTGCRELSQLFDGLRPEFGHGLPSIEDALLTVWLAVDHKRAESGWVPEDVCDENGQKQLSWRTLLLHELGAAHIAGELDYEEPWDSPVNRRIAASVPKAYRAGFVKSSDCRTRICAVVQEDGRWNSLEEWTEDTLLVEGVPVMVVAVAESRAVPWTQPIDVTVGEMLSLLDGVDDDVAEPPITHFVLHDGRIYEWPVQVGRGEAPSPANPSR